MFFSQQVINIEVEIVFRGHRLTTNRTDTQSNIVPIPGRDKTYQHCNNQGVPPKMQVHFNKCLPPRMQGPFLVC